MRSMCERSKGYALLDISDAKNPTAFRFILFAAMRNWTFLRVSLQTWSASSNGSMNYSSDFSAGHIVAGTRCIYLVVVGCSDEDDRAIVRYIERSSWSDFAKEDVRDGSPEEESSLVYDVRVLGD